jgi:hypothetical protein
MPFYFSKAFRLGPLLLNLSKSGLGLSGGIKGARVGITSRGRRYVHLGRGGIYYRRNLSGGGEENVMVEKDAADRASHPYVGMKNRNG